MIPEQENFTAIVSFVASLFLALTLGLDQNRLCYRTPAGSVGSIKLRAFAVLSLKR